MDENSLLKNTIDYIREHILNGEVKPGEKLNADGLARTLNISKTPVREAMNTLAAEKLVVYRPRLGYFVATLTAQEFLDLSELQEAIEMHIYLRLAYENYAIDHKALDAIGREIVCAIEDRDSKRLFMLNEDFHTTLCKDFKNRKILERLREVWNELIIHRLHMFSSPVFLQTVPADHDEIVAAICSKEADRIIKAVQRHFANGSRAAIEALPLE